MGNGWTIASAQIRVHLAHRSPRRGENKCDRSWDSPEHPSPRLHSRIGGFFLRLENVHRMSSIKALDDDEYNLTTEASTLLKALITTRSFPGSP